MSAESGREWLLARCDITPAGYHSDCWIWRGAKTRDGYAITDAPVRFRHISGKRTVSVHRFAYQLLVGPTPQHLHIDHLCRNRACCNTEHLELVTPQENTARGIRSYRTHCQRGHAMTPENVKISATGHRWCRECRKMRLRKEWREERAGDRHPSFGSAAA